MFCYKPQFKAKTNTNPSKRHWVEKINNSFTYLDNLDNNLALNNDDFKFYTKDFHTVELSLNKVNIDNKRLSIS